MLTQVFLDKVPQAKYELTRLSLMHANLRLSWCWEGSHTVHECDCEGEPGMWLWQEYRTQGIKLRQLHYKG